MANCFLLLACLLFSFACNLIKKLYDDKDYSTALEMLKSAAVSGLAGFVFAMILSEFFSSPIAIVSLSGLGGFFGTKALNALIQTNISARLQAGDALRQLIDESSIPQPTNVSLSIQDEHTINELANPPNNLYDEHQDRPPVGNSSLTEEHHVKIHVVRRDS